ncbi:MAG: hypothetical protein E6I83_08240 [Chloroflexi bacterium]|nr:MAG: hypothetical protein E6I83_08240 [Chloroflexota bacterium]
MDARLQLRPLRLGALQARIHGHEHTPSVHASQYGPKTAFGVGGGLGTALPDLQQVLFGPRTE